MAVLQLVVDDNLAVDLVVVEGLDDLGHGNDARDGETVLGLDLLLSGGHATLADLHAVERHDEALDFDVGAALTLG